jgi:glutathione S-transferase
LRQNCTSPSALSWGVDISGFPHVAAHFKRMLERRSAKKLLAYEKRSE